MSQPNDTNEPSPASSGSHGVAVGWILFYGERMTFDVVFDDRDEAEKYCRAYERKPDIVPVYRSPTLTDEEREAVHRLCRAVTHYSAGGGAVDGGSFARDDERAVAVVRGWLARLT